MHPGRKPVRGIQFQPRPKAYFVVTVEVAGVLLRRGQHTRHPSKFSRFPRRPKAYVTYGGGSGVLPGYGTAGAATFLLSLQAGTKAIYSWSTSIVPSYDGSEQRESPFAQPKRRFEGNAFLLDGADRDVRGAMMRSAASGATFLLALPFEAVTIEVDSPAKVATVASTAGIDWAVAGQRVVVVGRDGTSIAAVVQSWTATTITLDVVLATIGRTGAVIMPLIPVLLDPNQGFARYPTRVDMWSLRAISNSFGFAGADSMGVGAAISTMPDGDLIPIGDITDDDLLIWTQPNAIDGQANESMLSGAETVDMGALPFAIGGQTTPHWGRSLKLRSRVGTDWQWFKAFVRKLRGRQGAFLLSTNRPDLALVSNIAGVFKVASPTAAGAGGGDYASWFASTAHRRLAITANDVTAYRTVSAVVDNGDGTLTLTLDSGVAGTVTKISYLEQVRFDRDELEVTWDGATFSIDEVLVTTTENITPVPPKRMYDTVLSLVLSQAGDASITRELQVTLGKTTWIDIEMKSFFVPTNHTSLILTGIAATGGNVDGMIVTIRLLQFESAQSLRLQIESVLASSPVNRLLAPTGTTNVIGGGTTYRYNGVLQRWVMIAKTD